MTQTVQEDVSTTQEAFDEMVSYLAQSWQVDTESVDVWSRVEAAITKTQIPLDAVATSSRQREWDTARTKREHLERLTQLAASVSASSQKAYFSHDAERRARETQTPFVDLSKHTPEPEAVATLTASRAYQYGALPIKKDGNRLWVAMRNPRDTDAVDAVRMATRCLVQPMFAEPKAWEEAIAHVYGSLMPPPPTSPTAIAAPAAPEPDDTRSLLREMLTELREARRELAALHAEVAALRRDRANAVPPRPSTVRLCPFAPPDSARHDHYGG